VAAAIVVRCGSRLHRKLINRVGFGIEFYDVVAERSQ
jgi:hypothetical protein